MNKFNISIIVVACKACLDGPGVSTYGTEDPVLPSIPVNFFHGSSPLFFFIGALVFGFFVFLFVDFPRLVFLLLQLGPGSSSAVLNSGES